MRWFSALTPFGYSSRSLASSAGLRARPPPSPLGAALRPRPPHSPIKPLATLAALLRLPNPTGAPPPPHPRGLRLPLRGAVSVLAVTRCGMIAAPLSREVTLLRIAPSPDGLRGLWACWGCSNARSVFARLPPWPLFALKGAAPLPPRPPACSSFAFAHSSACSRAWPLDAKSRHYGRRSSPSVARRSPSIAHRPQAANAAIGRRLAHRQSTECGGVRQRVCRPRAGVSGTSPATRPPRAGAYLPRRLFITLHATL